MKKELDLDVPGVREGKMETHLDILSSSLESSIFKWKPIPKTVKDDMGRDLVTYISEDVYLTEQIDYLIEQGISEKNISARFMSYCVFFCKCTVTSMTITTKHIGFVKFSFEHFI